MKITPDSVSINNFPASLARQEDSPAFDGDTGVMTLAVRQDGDYSPVTSTGDYQGLLTDTLGNLKVVDKGYATYRTQQLAELTYQRRYAADDRAGTRFDRPETRASTR